MKHRYLAFTYASYYPHGGMRDCRYRGGDFEEAKRVVDNHHESIMLHGGGHIYDCQTGEVHKFVTSLKKGRVVKSWEVSSPLTEG